MRSNRHQEGLAARFGLALAAGLFCLAPATAQEHDGHREHQEGQEHSEHQEGREHQELGDRRLPAARAAQARSDLEYEKIIHRLELGMAALEELGRREALQALRRITDEVRDERAAAKSRGSDRAPRREQDSEIEVVRKRLAVMRYAVEALVKAEKRDAAEAVELAMHARELAIEGRRDAEAQKIREKAPDRAQLAELLGYSARLCKEFGQGERAQALAELSKVYADQWRRRQQAAREGVSRETDINLEALEQRIEIVRAAHVAYREANKRDGADILKRFLHVAELQQSGADGTVIVQAFEGLDQRTLVELLRGASRMYREWGRERKAVACHALAEFYTKRWNLEKAVAPEGEGEAKRPWNLDERGPRVQILRYGRGALAEAGWETAAEQMGRMVQIGELQLEGESAESAEKISQLAEGLSMELVVDHLERASNLYREWDMGERARLCAALAKFYAERDLEAAADGERAMEARERDHEAALRQRMNELTQRLEALQAQLREVEAQLKEAQQDPPKKRR